MYWWSIFFAPGVTPAFEYANLPPPVPCWDWDSSTLIDLALALRTGVLQVERGLNFSSPAQKVVPRDLSVKFGGPTTVVKLEPGALSSGRSAHNAIMVLSSDVEGKITVFHEDFRNVIGN